MGIELIDQSLIETRGTETKPPLNHGCAWIFFSSPSGVEHFLSMAEIPSNLLCGAMGEGTAEKLREKNILPDFVGEGTDTSKTAQQFAARIKDQRVLFPIGKSSKKSIQQMLPENQVTNLICYETIERNTILPPSLVACFTSPSNVASFSAVNEWRPKAGIAIGPATADKMRSLQFPVDRILKKFDEESLQEAIFELFSSLQKQAIFE